MAREGWLDPYVATGLLGPLLRHVHVKNLRPGRVADGPWTWSHTTLADGIVDWKRVFRALDRAGYQGWLVLDHLSTSGAASLTEDVAALRAYAAGAS
jgi:sugar phosphate isomerase/epimerase